MRIKTAAVIGGGIAGPVAALALRKAGIEATVYEAHDRPADGVGGTIALAPNGVAALGIVGVELPASQPADRQVMAVGGKRIELPGVAGAGPMHVVRRGDLHRVLRDAFPDVVSGRRLVSAVSHDDSVIADFSDGSMIKADVLVGADGVHSVVRGLIDPSAPGPRFTGMLAFEGRSRFEVPERPGTMTFAFGKRGYYLYWPAPGGGTTFGVNLPWPRPLTIAEARATPAADWLRTLLEIYGDDTPGGDLLRHIDPADLQVNGALHIMPPVPHWSRGRMVLTGDAVHAPSNSSGQGASLAIESAVELARCLRDISPIHEAFRKYEDLRRGRVERIAAQAARINSTKTPGRLGQALLPLIIRLALNPEKTSGPALRYRIDWDSTL